MCGRLLSPSMCPFTETNEGSRCPYATDFNLFPQIGARDRTRPSVTMGDSQSSHELILHDPLSTLKFFVDRLRPVASGLSAYIESLDIIIEAQPEVSSRQVLVDGASYAFSAFASLSETVNHLRQRVADFASPLRYVPVYDDDTEVTAPKIKVMDAQELLLLSLDELKTRMAELVFAYHVTVVARQNLEAALDKYVEEMLQTARQQYDDRDPVSSDVVFPMPPPAPLRNDRHSGPHIDDGTRWLARGTGS